MCLKTELVSVIQQFYHMHNKFSINRQPHYSPTKFIKQVQRNFVSTSQTHQFVPFAKERDGLGKLIKNYQPDPLPSVSILPFSKKQSESPLKYNITPETCITVSERIDIIQQTLSRSFQFNDPKIIQNLSSNKIPIHKKTIPKVRKYSDESVKTSKYSNQVDVIPRARFLSSDLTLQRVVDKGLIYRSQSLPRLNLNNKDTLTKKTNQIINKHQQFEQLKSLQSNSEETTKYNSHISKQKIMLPLCRKIYLQNNQFQQSYKRWPKLNENIQKANEIFLKKIRESKKLAFQLKVSLESQQWSQE